MIVTYFTLPKEKSLETLKKDMLMCIGFVNESDRDWLADYYYDVLFDEESDGYTLDKIKDELKGIIDTGVDVADCRQSTWIEHKGDRIYMTGGLSWGDGATSIYDDFHMFAMLKSYLKDYKDLDTL